MLFSESLHPKPTEAEYRQLEAAKNQQIEQLKAGMESTCQALEEEIRDFKHQVAELNGTFFA